MTLTAPASQTSFATAAAEGGPHIPGPNDFWLPLFGPEGWQVTEQMVWSTVAVALLCTTMIALSRRAAVVPTKGQWLLEKFYELPRNAIGRDMLGNKEFRRFVPLLVTLFSTILVFNLLGAIPPVMNPVNGVIGFPIAFTIVAYVVYHVVGIQRHGLLGYFKHMVPPGLPVLMIPIVFVLELVTYFITRPLTLALRLFGNMFAGHMLILLLAGSAGWFLLDAEGAMKLVALPAYLMASLMLVFELLIQFLQAFVFTLLTASYLAGVLADDH